MGTQAQCQAKCEEDRDCEFFLWGQGSSGYYRCATFQACNDLATYEDGEVKVFRKHHARQATYVIAFEDRWCGDGALFDNCLMGHCLTNGYTTQARCEAQCNENADCNFIVWGWNPSGYYRCAGFKTCDQHSSYIDGDGTKVFKKPVSILTAAPTPAPTPPPTPAPTPAPTPLDCTPLNVGEICVSLDKGITTMLCGCDCKACSDWKTKGGTVRLDKPDCQFSDCLDFQGTSADKCSPAWPGQKGTCLADVNSNMSSWCRIPLPEGCTATTSQTPAPTPPPTDAPTEAPVETSEDCGCDKYRNGASSSSKKICMQKELEQGKKICRKPNNGNGGCTDDHVMCRNRCKCIDPHKRCTDTWCTNNCLHTGAQHCPPAFCRCSWKN